MSPRSDWNKSLVFAILVFVMMGVGLNIVVGYAGLLDLGYVAFYAIGAYTCGWLASGQFQQVKLHFGAVGVASNSGGIHISVWLVLLIAAIVTAVGGILIGLPTLRLRGDYLAIVTLGFGEIIPQFVRNGDDLHGFDLTHGTFGISPIDPPGFGHTLHNAIGLPVQYNESFPPTPDRLFFWTILGLLLLTLFCSVILGGMGGLWGVVVAGTILSWLNFDGLGKIGSWINSNPLPASHQIDVPKYSFGIYGVIIVLMMMFRPVGLIPERRRKREIEEETHGGPLDEPLYEMRGADEPGAGERGEP